MTDRSPEIEAARQEYIENQAPFVPEVYDTPVFLPLDYLESVVIGATLMGMLDDIENKAGRVLVEDLIARFKRASATALQARYPDGPKGLSRGRG